MALMHQIGTSSGSMMATRIGSLVTDFRGA